MYHVPGTTNWAILPPEPLLVARALAECVAREAGRPEAPINDTRAILYLVAFESSLGVQEVCCARLATSRLTVVTSMVTIVTQWLTVVWVTTKRDVPDSCRGVNS